MGNTTTRRLVAVSRAARWASLALRVGLIGAVLSASATPVLGQDDDKAVKKIIDLNKKALTAIDGKKFDVARDGLLQAVTTAKQANLLMHKMLARTYVHLGAVYFLGYNDRKSALKYFGLAKSIRADIQLTPSLATPNLTAVFDKVSAEGGSTEASGDTAKPSRRPPPRAPSLAQPIEPAPTPLAPPMVAQGEPELPLVLPADLYCPAVEESPEGQEIVIRCAVKPTLKAERILLYFRASGAPTYSVAAMQNSPKGWLEASVPATTATGESLQYYCEARDSADNVVATNGQEDIPNPIILKPAVAGATRLPVATGGKGDEDALAGIKHEQENEILEKGIHRRRTGAFWIGAGWGTGWGYHLSQRFEWRADANDYPHAGVHSVGWLNFYPEVGYLITEHIGVAVQGRLEYIPIEGSGDTNPGRPANGAYAVLGRGLYYLDLGAGNAQIQFSASLGWGDYRFAYPPTNSVGAKYVPEDPTKPTGPCKKNPGTDTCIWQPTLLTDTIRSGSFLYGVGAGFIYHFTHWFAANFELRFLGAGPHLGLLLEGYTSAQFSIGGKPPARPGDAPPMEMERLPEEDEAEE